MWDGDLSLVICSLSSSELSSAVAEMPLELLSLGWRWPQGLENGVTPKNAAVHRPSTAQPRVPGGRQEPNPARRKVWLILGRGWVRELPAKIVSADGSGGFQEILKKCLKKRSVEIC